jgi:hypothetical protein
MDLLSTFRSFCSKFSPEKDKNIITEIDHYSYIISCLFNLDHNQIKKGSEIIILTILSIGIIFLSLSVFSFIYKMFFLFLCGYLYSKLNNCFIEYIQKKEARFINYYQILILEINVLFAIMKDDEDRNSLLLNILSQNPSIILNYEEIQRDIILGKNLENSLKKILFFSPIFQKYFNEFLEFDYHQNIFDFIFKYNNDFEDQFKIFLNSLETRLNLFFFVSFFYPVSFLYISSTYSLSIIDIFSAVVLFFLIANYFAENMIKNSNHLIGIFGIDFDGKRKFLIFLHFFKELSYNLISNPPDTAIFQAILKLNNSEKKILNLDQIKNGNNIYSLNDLIDTLFLKINLPQLNFFVVIFKKILTANSKSSSNLFGEIFKLIKTHLELSQNQEIMLKSSAIKINLIEIVLAFILGSLTPILINFSLVFNQINQMPDIWSIQSNNQNLWLYFLINLTFLIISVYSLNKINYTHHRKVLTILLCVLYFISFLISKDLIQLLL